MSCKRFEVLLLSLWESVGDLLRIKWPTHLVGVDLCLVVNLVVNDCLQAIFLSFARWYKRYIPWYFKVDISVLYLIYAFLLSVVALFAIPFWPWIEFAGWRACQGASGLEYLWKRTHCADQGMQFAHGVLVSFSTAGLLYTQGGHCIYRHFHDTSQESYKTDMAQGFFG